MKIDTIEKLKANLKVFKMKFLKGGCDKMQLYPLFCAHYDKNKERYQLPKETVLDYACEILIENA